jgi:hypothetical protein
MSPPSADVAGGNFQELHETVSRLSSHKGVEAVQILNRAGDIVAAQTTGSTESSTGSSSSSSLKQAKLIENLHRAATEYLHSTTTDDESDEISFLQLRTKQGRELYLSPHQGFVLAVLKRS